MYLSSSDIVSLTSAFESGDAFSSSSRSFSAFSFSAMAWQIVWIFIFTYLFI
jgi:hypothetical protein